MIIMDLVDERKRENRPEEHSGPGSQPARQTAASRPENSQGSPNSGILYALERLRRQNLLRAAQEEQPYQSLPLAGPDWTVR